MLDSSDVESPIKPVGLFDLDQELLLHICNYLPWPSLVSFRLTWQRIEQLLTPQRMIKHHSRCCVETLEKERQMSADLCINDLGWPLWTFTSAHPTLPCYNCLEWKTSANPLLDGSAFTRSLSVGPFDLGMPDAAKRLCITCGISTGYYTHGCRMGYRFLCRRCDRQPARDQCELARMSRAPHMSWKGSRYCQQCIDRGGLPRTYYAHKHQLRWDKYEEAMRARVIHRRDKGNKIRMQLSLPLIASEDERDAEGKRGWRFCKIRGKLGMCDCELELARSRVSAGLSAPPEDRIP